MEFLTRLRGKNGARPAPHRPGPVLQPRAARAREETDRQHELVLPTPSPGTACSRTASWSSTPRPATRRARTMRPV